MTQQRVGMFIWSPTVLSGIRRGQGPDRHARSVGGGQTTATRVSESTCITARSIRPPPPPLRSVGVSRQKSSRRFLRPGYTALAIPVLDRPTLRHGPTDHTRNTPFLTPPLSTEEDSFAVSSRFSGPLSGPSMFVDN